MRLANPTSKRIRTRVVEGVTRYWALEINDRWPSRAIGQSERRNSSNAAQSNPPRLPNSPNQMKSDSTRKPKRVLQRVRTTHLPDCRFLGRILHEISHCKRL